MKARLLLICLLITSCAVPVVEKPVAVTPAKPAPLPKAPTPASPVTSIPSTAPTTPVAKPVIEPVVVKTNHPLNYQSLTIQGITLSILSFDSSQYQLKIADQEPGSIWTSARNAATALDGIAAINAGFFGTEGKPLGLVRSEGKSSGAWNGASSLTSGVYQLSSGIAELKRNRSANRKASELLQTGPFLLENSQPVGGLATTNPAQRSFLLWDGQNHFAIAQSSSCTLSQLSKALKSLPSHLPKKTALNLDGGRSCDLYVSAAAHSAPIQRGHWLKSQVRNYLVLIPH